MLADPWLYVHHREALEGDFGLSKPFIMVLSEHFAKICPNFDIWACLRRFLSVSKRQYLVHQTIKNPEDLQMPCQAFIIPHLYHEEQFDLSVVAPLELAFSERLTPNPDNARLYSLHGQLWLRFLDGLEGFNQTEFKSAQIQDRVRDVRSWE